MATITTAQIVIAPDTTNVNRSIVTVTCTISFVLIEMELMKQGLKFRLDCKLWGEDLGQGNWLNPDDFILAFASKIYPDASPTMTEIARFSASVPNSWLNEDIGTDEIYGDILLTNLFTNVALRRKTPVFVHSF
jgi:hypothetical protein